MKYRIKVGLSYSIFFSVLALMFIFIGFDQSKLNYKILFGKCAVIILATFLHRFLNVIEIGEDKITLKKLIKMRKDNIKKIVFKESYVSLEHKSLPFKLLVPLNVDFPEKLKNQLVSEFASAEVVGYDKLNKV